MAFTLLIFRLSLKGIFNLFELVYRPTRLFETIGFPQYHKTQLFPSHQATSSANCKRLP